MPSNLTHRSMCPSDTQRRFLRPPKFGLRSLFIAIALFAVLAGLYGRRMVLMSREYAAARQVIHLGGRVTYGGRRSLQRETALTRLVGYLAFDDFDDVTAVGFQDVRVGDEDITVLRSFRRVQHVTLGGTLVTDECIDTLLELPQLKSVGLWKTDVSDAGIQRLKMKYPMLMVYDGH